MPKTDQIEIPFFAERLAAGDTLWTYICCSPISPYANLFIDSSAIEHRILFWQTKQIGATGFLLWSTTWWKELGPTAASGKPCFPDVSLDMRSSREYRLQWVHVNGDGILIYPGKDITPLPSIRLEVIRDGIEDYEYLSLLEELKDKVKKLPVYKTPEGSTLIMRAEQLCKVPDFISKDFRNFTEEPQKIIDQRKKVGDMIEQLANVLEEKDYEKWWNVTDNYFNLIE